MNVEGNEYFRTRRQTSSGCSRTCSCSCSSCSNQSESSPFSLQLQTSLQPRHLPSIQPLSFLLQGCQPDLKLKNTSAKTSTPHVPAPRASHIPMLKDHTLALGLDGSLDQIQDIKICNVIEETDITFYSRTGLDIDY